MRLSIGFTILLLARLSTASPDENKKEDDKVVITTNLYSLPFDKYKSQNDIISILVPLNSINFDEDDSNSSEEFDRTKTIFFVEANVDDDKKRIYKGLYIFKNDKPTMILENGQVAAASSDKSKKVFIGATDGLYVYKADTKETVKYGTITDNIIGIAVTNTSDIIYILTEDHKLYKVTDFCTTKTKVEDVVNAQQIVLDYYNNLYFYAEDKQLYVLSGKDVKRINGIPTDPSEIILINPPSFIRDGIPAIIDNKAYIIYANGTSEKTVFELQPEAKPSAYGMEASKIQYYAFDKKIYEFNIPSMVVGDVIEELKDYLQDKTIHKSNDSPKNPTDKPNKK